MSSSDGLSVRRLGTRWGKAAFLRGISFDVGPGEFGTLMGPNGSGKTTLLRALVGLEPTSEGEIFVAGAPVHRLPTHRRRIGLLFQEPTMLPGRSVRQNVAYGPELQHLPPAEVDRTVDEQLSLLHLAALADRPADRLSGGERQRVALARTLAARPAAVLLDEPFASVDPELRAGLRAEFRSALRAQGPAVLLVTHDREEGLLLGDQVMVLDDGQLVRAGPPADVAAAPRSARVARFLGYNLFHVEGRILGVRPDDLELHAPAPGGIRARVELQGKVGPTRIVYLRGDGGERWEARRPDTDPLIPEGEVSLRWRASVPLDP